MFDVVVWEVMIRARGEGAYRSHVACYMLDFEEADAVPGLGCSVD